MDLKHVLAIRNQRSERKSQTIASKSGPSASHEHKDTSLEVRACFLVGYDWVFTDSSIAARAGLWKILVQFRAGILKRLVSEVDIIEPGLLAFAPKKR